MLAHPAPELDVTAWLNGPPTTLAELRGRVVVLETFQMLCPGCVSHGLPQAQRVRAANDPAELVVLGLHTVFEHHEAMTPANLEVFISEYRLAFPVGVDRHVEGQAIPVTMQRYGLQGTPSTVLIDRKGQIRASHFGAVDDLTLGMQLGRLLSETGADEASSTTEATGPVCRPDTGCE